MKEKVVNKETDDISKSETRLHRKQFIGRVIAGLIISLGFAIISSALVGSSGDYAGKVLSEEDTKKYLLSFISVYGLLTILLLGTTFFLRKFRLSSLVVLACWIVGIFISLFILVFNTANNVRYDGLVAAENCVAIVLSDEGHGTGFSTKPGYLITNYHVIEGAKNLTVFHEIESTPKIVAYSKELDLAVLKLEKDIPICRWADSSLIKPGAELFAVGWPYNPYGNPTITKGIYSRTITAENAQVNLGLSNSVYIQTDAVINPGNSGGPLTSKDGVVGVNTAKISITSSSDVAEGLGYAISSDVAKNFLDTSISNKKE